MAFIWSVVVVFVAAVGLQLDCGNSACALAVPHYIKVTCRTMFYFASIIVVLLTFVAAAVVGLW